MHTSRRQAVLALSFIVALYAVGSLVSWAAEPIPLAMRGYDPVAYFTIGKPTLGRANLEYEWDEHRYRFSTAEDRALFKSDPARYAPQFANYCAMALSDGEVVEADPRYWLISGGKLYLFGKPVGPALFQQNLAHNVAAANQNRGLLPKR